MNRTYGVIALARPTFDMQLAEEMKNKAFAALDAAGIRTVGPRTLATDRDAAADAMREIENTGGIDVLLILQVTFTDASMTADLGRGSGAPVALWGVPEPRVGGRLRLNAYCGINLAAHALGKAGVPYRWLFADPAAADIGERLAGLAEPAPAAESAAAPVAYAADPAADEVVAALGSARITLIGQHPDGFETCAYDPAELAAVTGITVDPVALESAFDKAEQAPAERAEAHRAAAERSLTGLGDVDQDQLTRSFRLLCALEDIIAEEGADSIALRCWPEAFTDYGCAACAPMAMLNEAGVPSSCEADVYGSATTLMLMTLAGEPTWMADLVDVDEHDDTAVLWHCGLAPLSMCDPDFRAEATIHTNRRMPLLHQFPLKPGRITLARLSQSRNRRLLMVAGAEVIRAPMAFTGTSGVIRFDRPVGEVSRTIMDEALEHHYALAYGDHVEAMSQVANRLDVPLLRLA